MAIRYSNKPSKFLCSELLMDEVFYMVCSPKFLDKNGPIKSVKDIVKYNLLDQFYPAIWPEFLNLEGLGYNKENYLYFEHFYVLIQAVYSGSGIALLPYKSF